MAARARAEGTFTGDENAEKGTAAETRIEIRRRRARRVIHKFVAKMGGGSERGRRRERTKEHALN